MKCSEVLSQRVTARQQLVPSTRQSSEREKLHVVAFIYCIHIYLFLSENGIRIMISILESVQSSNGKVMMFSTSWPCQFSIKEIRIHPQSSSYELGYKSIQDVQRNFLRSSKKHDWHGAWDASCTLSKIGGEMSNTRSWATRVSAALKLVLKNNFESVDVDELSRAEKTKPIAPHSKWV